MRRRQLTIRISHAAYDALGQLPGASNSERAEAAILHQQVTAAIAQAVSQELRRVAQPLIDGLDDVVRLRHEVREYTREAAQASQAGEQIAGAVEARAAQREKETAERMRTTLTHVQNALRELRNAIERNQE